MTTRSTRTAHGARRVRYVAQQFFEPPFPLLLGGPWVKYAVSRARALGGGARRGARSVLSPAGLKGSAVELTWVAAHLVTYPFGVVEEKVAADVDRFSLEGLPPVRRGLI